MVKLAQEGIPGSAAAENNNKSFSLSKELVLLAALLLLAVLLLYIGYKRYMTAAYPLHFEEYVEKYAAQYDFDPSLIYALIRTESEFNPAVVSKAKAKGLMQLTDDTFFWAQDCSPEDEELHPDHLFDPETNIHYGTLVLRLLTNEFHELDTTLAAYNAGIGRVTGWLQEPAYSEDGVHLHTIPYEETRAYVERVLEAQEMYQELYRIP